MQTCDYCNRSTDQAHDEDCPVFGHELMLAGDPHAYHDPEDCPLCQLDCNVSCECRCGLCCSLIVEATAFDARREPRIRQYGSIIDEGGLIPPDEAGWLLNTAADGSCTFLRRDEHGRAVCSIYQTRPLACRLFDCDHDDLACELRTQVQSQAVHRAKNGRVPNNGSHPSVL